MIKIGKIGGIGSFNRVFVQIGKERNCFISDFKFQFAFFLKDYGARKKLGRAKIGVQTD